MTARKISPERNHRHGQPLAERREALVRIGHRLAELAHMRYRHHGRVCAIAPRVVGDPGDQRFGHAPGVFVQRIGGCAERRFLGVRRRDEGLARQIARELKGARVIGDLGEEPVARLHAALERGRAGERLVDARHAVRIEEVERPQLVGRERKRVVDDIVTVRELQHDEVRRIAHHRLLQQHELLRRAVAGDAEVQHLDQSARLEVAVPQLRLELQPPGVREPHAHRFGVLVAEHGDAVHGVGLVEGMLAVAKAGRVDDEAGAPGLARVRAALVRSQAPAEIGVELVKLGRAVAGEPQRHFEDGEQGKGERRGDGDAFHGAAREGCDLPAGGVRRASYAASSVGTS